MAVYPQSLAHDMELKKDLEVMSLGAKPAIRAR